MRFFLLCYFFFSACSYSDSINTLPSVLANKGIIEDTINENLDEPQNCEKGTQRDTLYCNTKVVATLSLSIDKPEDSEILNFLLTFSATCKNNVEYGEFSNEVLFDLLYKHPNKMFTYLTNDKVNLEIILAELESPVNDKYNIDDFVRLIEKTDECAIKRKVIEHLKKSNGG